MIQLVFKWLTGGALDRILDTVDRKVSAATDREAIKGEIIKTHYRTRAGFMAAGGFVLMLLFAVPLAFWFWPQEKYRTFMPSHYYCYGLLASLLAYC